MIPFAIPLNRNIVNLSQIVQIRQGAAGTNDEGTLTVHFSNGDIEEYEGEAARIMNVEIAFALECYRTFQQQTQSQIVMPDGRMM